MHDHTGRHRAVARLVTLALWGVGSAYLVQTELAFPTPNIVAMISAPIVWAAVIALPILGTFAMRERQYVAAILIWLAAVVGSSYAMSGTLSRSAETRDVLVAKSAELAKQRRQIEKDLADAKDMLTAARRKCSEGRECLPATKATIGVYEGAVAGHEHRLSKLDLSSPMSGERRLAALLSFATGKDLAASEQMIALIAPALFGLTLELSAFAVAMLGWHPTRKPLPRLLPLETIPANVGKHPVILALEQARRPVNNSELAKLMNVCNGEATKRRREVANVINVQRIGRECIISLKAGAYSL
jgi:hypothetical protein